MAFTPIAKTPKIGSRPVSTEVRLAIYPNHPKALVIMIPTDVVALLRSPSVIVHVGVGADEGLILLQPTHDKQAGYKLGKAGNTSARKISVSVRNLTADEIRPFKTTAVQYRMEPEGLIVHVGPVLRINKVSKNVTNETRPAIAAE